MTKDPLKLCEAFIGQRLTSIEVDADNFYVRLNFDNGFMEIEGEDFELYLEPKETN